MGAGRTRGGPGLHFEVEVLGTGQVDVYGFGDGIANPPFGIYGGTPGDGGALYRINPDGTRTFSSAITYLRVREGERWVSASSGGGGYGDPLDRDADRVLADIRDGYVSVAAAEELYGVALEAGGRSVDRTATAQRRTRERSTVPLTPIEPGAGTYQALIMRPEDTFELNPHPAMDADITL
jgi:N-methylhydantoinase B